MFRFLPDGSVEVTPGDFEVDGRPGAPRLPFTSTLIALPPGAVSQLRVIATETYTVPLPGPLAVAPEAVGVERDRAGNPIGLRWSPADHPLPPPSEPVVLEEVGVVRGIRLARLTVYSALPVGDHLRVIRRLRVEVRWAGAGAEAGPPPSPDDPLLQQVRRAVLNPQDVLPAPSTAPTGLSATPAGGGLPTAFLEVRAPGLYRVSCDGLLPLGFGTVNPHTLRLFRGADEALLEWQGDDDAVCESGETFYFYAEPRFSRWTAVDAYRLAPAAPGPNPMPVRPADPTGLPLAAPWVERTLEENREYTPDRFTPGVPPGRDGDRWAWDYLTGPMQTPKTYSFSLTAADAAASASLTIWAIGHTATEHRWAVLVNGTAVGEVAWSGRTVVTATLPVPPGVLRAGPNTLALRPLLAEGGWLDAFAVRHALGAAPAGASVVFGERVSFPPSSGELPAMPSRLYLPLALRYAQTGARAYRVTLAAPGPYRAYDVTDPLRPVRLTGFRVDGFAVTLGDPPEGGPRRYLVVAESAIRAPDRIRPREDLWGFRAAGGAIGADYLIITHPAFADALGPLIALRRSQGLTVTVANVLGIYDAYGDGRPDPEAIRRFIADFYATGNPRPRYVLLVGDGSYDPRQYRSTSPPTFIPPYLADVEPYSSEAAADNRYVCVDGDDNLPDLLLGRLPVRSADPARAVVEKIVRYETAPLPGGWNAKVVLVADDPDAAGDFRAISEAAATYVTDPFTVTRRYCPGTAPNRSDCSDEDAIRAAVLNDWNRGALIVQYAGHASWQQWAAERFFHLEDIPALANSRSLPVVAEMTCFTGAFHRPEPTLDEELLLRQEAGAVATWGPTGLGVGAGHRRLSEGFFRAVFSDTVGTVGEAALAGKLNLLGAGQGQDLIDTFHLLGDPALRFQRSIVPWAARVFLPLVSRSR